MFVLALRLDVFIKCYVYCLQISEMYIVDYSKGHGIKVSAYKNFSPQLTFIKLQRDTSILRVQDRCQ